MMGSRKGLESSETSGLSTISSESEDDFMSSISSSSKWDSSSEDEIDERRDRVKHDKESKTNYDSDAESVEYQEARSALDLLELEDFNFIRFVDQKNLMNVIFVYIYWDGFLCREKTPDGRSTPLPESDVDWSEDSDDEASESEQEEKDKGLDHLTLAERIALKRKTEQKVDNGLFSFKNQFPLNYDEYYVHSSFTVAVKKIKIDLSESESSPTTPIKENIEPVSAKTAGNLFFCFTKIYRVSILFSNEKSFYSRRRKCRVCRHGTFVLSASFQ